MHISAVYSLSGCFFCGIDSRILLIFVGLFVSSMIMATTAFFIWSLGKKGSGCEAIKYSILENEMDEPVASSTKNHA
jgi:hypothetical protein